VTQRQPCTQIRPSRSRQLVSPGARCQRTVARALESTQFHPKRHAGTRPADMQNCLGASAARGHRSGQLAQRLQGFPIQNRKKRSLRHWVDGVKTGATWLLKHGSTECCRGSADAFCKNRFGHNVNSMVRSRARHRRAIQVRRGGCLALDLA